MLAAPRMSPVSRRTRRLLLVVGAILAPLVGAEVYFRVADPPPLQWGWRDLFQRPQELNQLGLRGQPIEYSDDDLVVVLVGDSQVEGGDDRFAVEVELPGGERAAGVGRSKRLAERAAARAALARLAQAPHVDGEGDGSRGDA